MKIKNKGKKRIALRVVLIVALTVSFVAAVLCNKFIPQRAADFYGTNLFPYISSPAQNINMYFQYSLTENLVLCGVPLLATGIIVWFVFLIKKFMSHGALPYLYKSYRNVMVVALLVAVIFQAMHGINYRRTDVKDELELTEKELTFEDYCAALKWAYNGMVEARSHLGEDYNGIAHMSESFENSAAYANSLVNAFGEEYDIPVSKNYVRAKPVSMSHYWSYTHIVGMYDPFLGEVNLNTDYMSITEYPITLCHELCHSKGYASETDCNLLAALACCSSPRADFRYAGYYEIFWDIYPVAEDIAEATGQVVPQYYLTAEMEPVYRDMRAQIKYWSNIDDEVDLIYEKMGIHITEVSNATNDAFLRSNGEVGVVSYQVPDSIYVRFYLTYASEAANA